MRTGSTFIGTFALAALVGTSGLAAAQPTTGNAAEPAASGTDTERTTRGGMGPMMHDRSGPHDHRMMHGDDTMGGGTMGGGTMGGGTMGGGTMGGGTMGGGMMGGGMIGGGGPMDMMEMMHACGRMMNRAPTPALPRLPPGNEKLQLQMQAEMMQKMGEILAKYAARLPDTPGTVR